MITETEVIRRVKEAIDRIAIANDLKVLFRNCVMKAITDEFAIPDEWRVEEHKAGLWSIVNHVTGEKYTADGRDASRRLVTFRYISSAVQKAYELNKAAKK